MATPSVDAIGRSGEYTTDGLLEGHYWTSLGNSRVLTYALYAPARGTWSPALADALAAAFDAWSAVANIRFEKVTAPVGFYSSPADIAVSLLGNSFPDVPSAAFAIFPDTEFAAGWTEFWDGMQRHGVGRDIYRKPEGDIFLHEGRDIFSYLGEGSAGRSVLMHEIGHALGLKHPFDGYPTLPEYDLGIYTLMSYAAPLGGGDIGPAASGYQVTPMPLDIQAIQYLYGPNLGYRTGADTYRLKADGTVRTIWDAGGIDTISAAGLGEGVTAYLSPGSDIRIGAGTAHETYVALAYGVTDARGNTVNLIENFTGSAHGDYCLGNEADNLLQGRGGDDTLFGEGGDDTLDGGDGVDMMAGGDGNDLYVVDFAGETVDDVRDGGDDVVRSSVTFSLNDAPYVESLVLTGNAAIDGYGTNGPDRITGNGAGNLIDGLGDDDLLVGGTGNDIFAGGWGADTLIGGMGDDRYPDDGDGDLIVEAPGAGFDTLYTSFSVVLPEGIEGLEMLGPSDIAGIGNAAGNRVIGNAAANLIVGKGGDDSLDGGAGNDTLDGGPGNDAYVVDDPGDRIIEGEDAGNDTVFASVSLVIPDHVENLVLVGGAVALLSGNAADNRLTGGTGADTLGGGGGSDTLAGGGGDDTYLVEDGAVVQEVGGGGIDTVVFDGSGGYPLGPNVENLRLPEGPGGLAGVGGGEANTLTGNDAGNRLDGGGGNDTLLGLGGDDYLIGGAGNDRLDGGRGADRMEGGGGDDRYVVGKVLDLVIEGAGGGTDSVEVHLPRYVLPENVENAVGDGRSNTLVGNALANRLEGGGGADRFEFERGPVAGVWDTVADFASGEDALVLSGGWTGYLPADFLRAGPGLTTAAAAGHRLIYDTSTGSLYYDPDGTGAQAALKLAVLEGTPALQAADIQVG